jgi:ribosomal protein S18 acetylase RimI-like enzyme
VGTALPDEVAEIEEALIGHWSHFGRWPKGALVEEAGTVRYETPIPQLPYNGVIRTSISEAPAVVIDDVLSSFRKRQVSCLWWDHPNAEPNDLGSLLRARGLQAVERVAGMSIDLATVGGATPETEGVRYVEVLDNNAMRRYSDLIVDYWEVPEDSRTLVEEINRFWGPGTAPLHRWIAVTDRGEAIGKVLLSLAAPPGVAAIYGMSVRPQARGRGVASALTDVALGRAKELKCRRVVLHSSEMAVGVYERSGFRKRCDLTVYANSPLWASRKH